MRKKILHFLGVFFIIGKQIDDSFDEKQVFNQWEKAAFFVDKCRHLRHWIFLITEEKE